MFFILLLAFIVIFAIMQFSTRGILRQMREAFADRTNYYYTTEEAQDVPSSPTVEVPVVGEEENIAVYRRYGLRDMLHISEDVSMDNWVIKSRLMGISFHNFKDGRVLVWYHLKADAPPGYMSKMGDRMVPDSGNIFGTSFFYPAVLTVHKENGEWKVTNIAERP